MTKVEFEFKHEIGELVALRADVEMFKTCTVRLPKGTVKL